MCSTWVRGGAAGAARRCEAGCADTPQLGSQLGGGGGPVQLGLQGRHHAAPQRRALGGVHLPHHARPVCDCLGACPAAPRQALQRAQGGHGLQKCPTQVGRQQPCASTPLPSTKQAATVVARPGPWTTRWRCRWRARRSGGAAAAGTLRGGKGCPACRRGVGPASCAACWTACRGRTCPWTAH